jgi:hypothetical protein
LIGSVVSYTFLGAYSSSAINSVNRDQKHQTVVSVSNIPIDTRLITQPMAHATVMPTPQKN